MDSTWWSQSPTSSAQAITHLACLWLYSRYYCSKLPIEIFHSWHVLASIDGCSMQNTCWKLPQWIPPIQLVHTDKHHKNVGVECHSVCEEACMQPLLPPLHFIRTLIIQLSVMCPVTGCICLACLKSYRCHLNCNVGCLACLLYLAIRCLSFHGSGWW